MIFLVLFNINTFIAGKRTKRFFQIEPIQVSRTCVVYDETPAHQTLTDDLTGSVCSILSVTQFGSDLNGITVTTKLISTANPLANYFTIQTENFSLLTSQRIDRELLCGTANSQTFLSEQLERCCTMKTQTCDLSVTILVQISIRRNGPGQNSNSSLGTNTRDQQRETISRFMKLSIKLIDVNDNAPTFPSSKHKLVVSEGVKVGTRLRLPLADDIDCDEFGISRLV